MEAKKQAISSDLQTQWQDHFHMRDQTWKVLQYSILFFLGVVGLEIKGDVDKLLLLAAYGAVLMTSLFGFFVALHHRRRQHEKFHIIRIYETELGLYDMIKPVLSGAQKKATGWKRSAKWIEGWINTSTYIVAMQAALAMLATLLFVKTLLSEPFN